MCNTRCKSYINRFKGAKYKSFKTLPEAEYFVKYGKSKPLQTLDQFIIKTNPSPIKPVKPVQSKEINMYILKEKMLLI